MVVSNHTLISIGLNPNNFLQSPAWLRLKSLLFNDPIFNSAWESSGDF